MKRFAKSKALIVAGAMLALSGIALAQLPNLKDLVKVIGIGAVVSRFGPEINREFNKLQNHKDTSRVKTRVVPILTVGVNASAAIGAAQIMGPPSAVEKVTAVAQPEVNLAGFRIRALIPVSSKDVIKDIRRVEGVGVSGIVDMKL